MTKSREIDLSQEDYTDLAIRFISDAQIVIKDGKTSYCPVFKEEEIFLNARECSALYNICCRIAIEMDLVEGNTMVDYCTCSPGHIGELSSCPVHGKKCKCDSTSETSPLCPVHGGASHQGGPR